MVIHYSLISSNKSTKKEEIPRIKAGLWNKLDHKRKENNEIIKNFCDRRKYTFISIYGLYPNVRQLGFKGKRWIS